VTTKLGIVAGGGDLPARAIEACQRSGHPFFVLAIEGQATHPIIDTVPHAWCRLGAAGKAEKLAREAGVTDVVMAGWVRRPSIREIRPDAKAAKFILKAGLNAWGGDDGILRALLREVEDSGFRIVGIHDVLPELLAEEKVYSNKKPDTQAEADIKRGIEVLSALGGVDVGQSAVVQQGIVLGVEAIEGTDQLIERSGKLRRKGPAGVLIKMKKPNQDMRVDLPTIGTRTVENASAAGLRGIAVEAGATLIVDEADTIKTANRAGLFLIGINPATFAASGKGSA